MAEPYSASEVADLLEANGFDVIISKEDGNGRLRTTHSVMFEGESDYMDEVIRGAELVI